jgi:hypothetical protein
LTVTETPYEKVAVKISNGIIGGREPDGSSVVDGNDRREGVARRRRLSKSFLR